MKTWILPLLLLLPAARAAAGGPAAPPQEPAAAAGFDHAYRLWGEILRDYVHPGGLVDYAGLKRRDRAKLQKVLRGMQSVYRRQYQGWTENQKMAFWINAYNAWTVDLIVRNHPVDSIKDLGGLFSSVFSKEFVPLNHLVPGFDDPLSLGEIEHEILGKRFPSPMFHFAIVCASRSCPELRDEPYRPEVLGRQLEEQARSFLADPAKNDQEVRGGVLRVSRIFDWSEDELERFPGGIRGLLKRYGPPRVASHPDLGKVRLRYRDYDWSLNEWKPEPGSR